jgi:hypothetical protein
MSKPALQRIAEQLEDGDGHALTELAEGEGFCGLLLTGEERQQLRVIISWVFTEEDELRRLYG